MIRLANMDFATHTGTHATFQLAMMIHTELMMEMDFVENMKESAGNLIVPTQFMKTAVVTTTKNNVIN